MNDLLEFLTSQEIIIVYIIAGVLMLLCFISYIVKVNSAKFRMKSNTKELNKLVEKVKKKVPVEEEKVEDEVPVLQTINNEKVNVGSESVSISNKEESSSVVELLDSTAELQPVKIEKEEPIIVEESNLQFEEPIIIDPVVIEDNATDSTIDINQTQESIVSENSVSLQDNESNLQSTDKKDELQYTSIEPSVEDAKEELAKLKAELEKQETMEAEMENIALNNYEEEQEATAIISLEELIKKSKDMYEANELTQYADEGNEPISLQDLERFSGEKASSYNEPFIIENVVPQNEIEELDDENDKPEIISNVVVENAATIENRATEQNTNTSRDMPEIASNRKFKRSPIISPIYGIEKSSDDVSPNELELENTANYEKLDEEIKKTNEFLMTLRELQKKLD